MKKVIILSMVAFMAACGTTSGPSKPSATGKTGEMLIVMGKNFWDGNAGEMVRDVFMAYIPMLPQAEPHFNLVHLEPNAFTRLFEPHRNIFKVNFDPSLERGKIEARRDVWSHPQMVINVTVPDLNSLEQIMDRNADSFIGFYLEKERERFINAYRRMMNHHARNLLREEFQLESSVPEGYFVAKHEDNFLWLRQTGTREDLELGVLVTILPYQHPDYDFDHETIRKRRDSMTRAHIPGTFEGTFMTTYPDIPHLFREINFNGIYAVEARGLWRVHNDFMGGPFINITFVDEKRSRLIILDGFVYAPKFDKRDYLRQVEALMHSIKPVIVAGQEEENEDLV